MRLYKINVENKRIGERMDILRGSFRFGWYAKISHERRSFRWCRFVGVVSLVLNKEDMSDIKVLLCSSLLTLLQREAVETLFCVRAWCSS